MPFFNSYSKFCSPGGIGTAPDLLNARHEVLIAPHAECFRNARVLDIAAHDGRWSFAALKAGAAHVTGIEARSELVDSATKTFAEYGVDPARYEMLCGSVFDVLPTLKTRFDTVLLFGFFYHTHRHVELLELIVRHRPRYVIVDTMVMPRSAVRDENPLVMAFQAEDVAYRGNAYEPTGGRLAIVGHPSRQLVTFLFEQFGYRGTELDWSAHVRKKNPELGPYNEGVRVSYVFTRAT